MVSLVVLSLVASTLDVRVAYRVEANSHHNRSTIFEVVFAEQNFSKKETHLKKFKDLPTEKKQISRMSKFKTDLDEFLVE